METELIPPEHLQPEIFHNLSAPLESQWDEDDVAVQYVQHHVRQNIEHPQDNMSANDKKVKFCWILFLIKLNLIIFFFC